MASNSSSSVGSIDEMGFLKNIYRKGFTIAKGLLENAANSLDADASTITYIIRRDTTSIIDNGNGMNEEDVRHMYAMYRENHRGECRRGVSGIGKSSSVLLSQQKSMVMFTRKKDCNFLRVDVPWERMFAGGKYSGMIETRSMTEDEKLVFLSERTTQHGTTFVFPTSNELRNIILKNFRYEEEDTLAPLDSIGVVYGRDNFTAICKDYEHGEKNLQLHNYFGESNSSYYGGISRSIISYYKNGSGSRDRFILETRDGEREIIPKGRGYSTCPVEPVENLLGYTLKGQFEIVCGLRYDPEMFDESSPAEIKNEWKLNACDKPTLGNDEISSRLFRSGNKIVRNKQTIGTFATPDFSLSSARADSKQMLTHNWLQVEVRYNPTSEQENEQDKMIGIQENKNQYNGDHLPLTFTRLVKYCRDEKGKEIYNYMQSRIAAAAPAPAPAPAAPEPAPAPAAPAAPEPAPEPAPAPAPAPEPAAPAPEPAAPAPEPALPVLPHDNEFEDEGDEDDDIEELLNEVLERKLREFGPRAVYNALVNM